MKPILFFFTVQVRKLRHRRIHISCARTQNQLLVELGLKPRNADAGSMFLTTMLCNFFKYELLMGSDLMALSLLSSQLLIQDQLHSWQNY